MSASKGAPGRAGGGRAFVPPPRGTVPTTPPTPMSATDRPSDPMPRRPIDPASRWVRRAWLSLLLFPVSLLAAFVVGEGLFALLGGTQGEKPPFWIALVGAGPALVVFALPAILALWFGRRATREGNPRGYTPALVGAVLVGLFVLQNALAYLVA